ncbi:hypothetical protein GWK47_017564 [Chionoecetes opilio]|uniref:Uncharacterized protein n=1 Tax=Chionoecetes opilio TaxID=41210 RepID=A0A8J4XVV2_CHIOP|nr:hypothetical protein GWK47_017564 [Chionoecetes opilio]
MEDTEAEDQRGEVQDGHGHWGNLFDVAHADALKLIKNPEDRDFLLAQREIGRRGSLGSVDLVLVREEAAQKKKEANARQIERTRMEQEALCSQVKLASYSSVSSESEGCVLEEKGAVGGDAGHPKRKRKQVENVWTPGLTAALDRTKISNRVVPYVLTEVAKSLGHDPVELNMSRFSVKRYRERYRAEKWADLKEGFKETGNHVSFNETGSSFLPSWIPERV